MDRLFNGKQRCEWKRNKYGNDHPIADKYNEQERNSEKEERGGRFEQET